MYHLTFSASTSTKEKLQERDLKMTWTLLLICSCYIIFVMPISVINMLDDFAYSYLLHLTFYCIYWFQYTLNFVIYAFRSKQYRKAYVYFLQESWQWWKVLLNRMRGRQHLISINLNSREIIQNKNPNLMTNQRIETISLTIQASIKNNIQVSHTDDSTSVLVYSKNAKNIKFQIQRENVFKEIQPDSSSDNSSTSNEISTLKKYHSL